jgi:YebC/PmpR family DNA-binding regulatory protein
MAGHSHWAGIKHKKGKADKIRSKLFSKLSREITVSAKMGLPDPSMNPRLRSAVQAARSANMPKDNIERAIKKSQAQDGQSFDKVQYEGFGPEGVAFIVEALTDNKNRTVSNVRSIFEKNSGSLGSEGSVSYQFERCGLIKVKKIHCSEEEIFNLIADSGAENIENIEDYYEITTTIENYNKVREVVESKIKELEFSDLIWKAKNYVNIENKETFTIVDNFNNQLEDDDDVQNVYSNAKIDKKLMMEI